MKKNAKFLIAGIVVLSAIAFITISGFKQNSVYYLEVHELQKDPSKFAKKGVRISGDVEKGSVKKDTLNKHLEFTMKDKTGSKMNVVYDGLIPDAFTEDVQVIVEGKYAKENNTFTAKTLLAKCPSKYEAEVKK